MCNTRLESNGEGKQIGLLVFRKAFKKYKKFLFTKENSYISTTSQSLNYSSIYVYKSLRWDERKHSPRDITSAACRCHKRLKAEQT